MPVILELGMQRQQAGSRIPGQPELQSRWGWGVITSLFLFFFIY